ncbi:MAG: hypothetical protein DMF88_25715 [Acidobacteria bacterium]|nr:MAG: hypothetical protein DMF88_25715 [Acidobacteriota bacterium]
MLRTWRRNSSSNTRSWSDEWSSPYHQNQSDPSAMSSSSHARASASGATPAADSSVRRASASWLQAR